MHGMKGAEDKGIATSWSSYHPDYPGSDSYAREVGGNLGARQGKFGNSMPLSSFNGGIWRNIVDKFIKKY
jgi:hypothetical protein